MADEPEQPDEDDDEVEIGFVPESVEVCVTGDSLFCDSTPALRKLAGLPDDAPLAITGFEGAFAVGVLGKGLVALDELFKQARQPRKLAAIKGDKV